MTCPEVTWPELEVTWQVVIACACATGSRAFFLTIVVVQNVQLRMTGSSMATRCDVIKRDSEVAQIFVLVQPFNRKWRHQMSRDPEGIPLEGWGARMSNRKLRDIRGGGATGSDVTGCSPDPKMMWLEMIVCACATDSCPFFYYSSSTKCTIVHDRHGYRMSVTWPVNVIFHLCHVYMTYNRL